LHLVVRAEPGGLLVFEIDTAILIQLNRDEALRLGYRGEFPEQVTAPRFVHIEISNRCNRQPRCIGCYVKEMNGVELTNAEVRAILTQLAEMKVCSVTFGGGEPFMRADIFDLAEYASSQGLVVLATTNGILLRDMADLAVFKQVNVSYHGDLELAEHAVRKAKKYTNAGVNFVASKLYINSLPQVAELCRREDAELLLLTYKPVDGDYENQVPPRQVLKIAEALSKSGVRVAFDGLTCLTCVAGEYFVDIASTGDVYPCSFVRETLGNVKATPFKTIWSKRRRVYRCPYLAEGERPCGN